MRAAPTLNPHMLSTEEVARSLPPDCAYRSALIISILGQGHTCHRKAADLAEHAEVYSVPTLQRRLA